VKFSKIKLRNTLKKIPSNEKVWREFEKNPPAFSDLLKQDTTIIQKFADTERKKWRSVLILGIGGSSLGAQAIISALAVKNSPEFYFLDNLDPIETHTVLKKINLRQTLVLVITKSGGTLETMAQFFAIRKKLKRQQIIAITDAKDGFLRQFAEQEKLITFEIPRNIGGRFSALTPVGLVPAALAGVKITSILNGAKAVNPREAFEFARVHAAEFKRGKNISACCTYSSQLRKFNEWYSQLLGESIGKNSQTGVTPTTAIGATDQHSQLQLWSDGPNDKFFIFSRVMNFGIDYNISNPPTEFKFLAKKSFTEILNTEFLATTQALIERKRSLATFEIPQVNAQNLGWLLSFFQFEIALLGKILKVNPFNQPGVERSKILAHKLLTR